VTGLLKLIFHSETRQLPGVHIIGEGASELIHIGQAVLSFGGTIDYYIETVFNYPTLAECTKVAAFDGINQLGIFEPDPAEIRQTDNGGRSITYNGRSANWP
jgi:NAD(P) transhydrogenase